MTPPFGKGRRRRPKPAFAETPALRKASGGRLRAGRPDFGAGRLGGFLIIRFPTHISLLV